MAEPGIRSQVPSIKSFWEMGSLPHLGSSQSSLAEEAELIVYALFDSSSAHLSFSLHTHTQFAMTFLMRPFSLFILNFLKMEILTRL